MKRTFLVISLTLFLSACFETDEAPQPKYKSSDVLVTQEQKGKLVKIVEILSDEKPKIDNLVYALSHSLTMTSAPRFADIIFSEASSVNLDVREYLHRLTDHKDDLETIVSLATQAAIENNFHNTLIRKDMEDIDEERYSRNLKLLITTSASIPAELSETLKLINEMTVIENLSEEEVINLLKNKMLIDL
jgi:hypothetical protein